MKDHFRACRGTRRAVSALADRRVDQCRVLCVERRSRRASSRLTTSTLTRPSFFRPLRPVVLARQRRVVLAPPDDAGREAGCYRVGRQRPSHHRACADGTTVSDLHAGRNEDPRTEPDIVADDNVALVPTLVGDGLVGKQSVVRGGDVHLGAEATLLSDRDPAARVAGPEKGALAHLRAGSNGDPLRVSERDVRCDRRARAEREPPARPGVRVAVVMEEPHDLEVRHGVEQRAQRASQLRSHLSTVLVQRTIKSSRPSLPPCVPPFPFFITVGRKSPSSSVGGSPTLQRGGQTSK